MSPTPVAKGSNKSSKQSRKVILRLKPDLLAKFASASSAGTASEPVSSPIDGTDAASNGTPRPADSTLDAGSAKKKLGAKPGIKRNASAANLDALKPKGKPGPKKKPRNADGTIDRSQDTPRPVAAAAATGGAPKLGPKANMGAINAGLRALDRSGKPCRRWDRKGFNLKSFTGVTWDINSWRAPVVRASPAEDGEGKSDGSSTGDNKPRMDSSAVPSESSRGGDAVARMNGIASSPAPVPA